MRERYLCDRCAGKRRDRDGLCGPGECLCYWNCCIPGFASTVSKVPEGSPCEGFGPKPANAAGRRSA